MRLRRLFFVRCLLFPQLYQMSFLVPGHLLYFIKIELRDAKLQEAEE